MQNENNYDDNMEYKRKIMELERQQYYFERANSDLQTDLYERSMGKKYGPYLFLVAWFILLKFMENWMGYYVDISLQNYVPILFVFIVLLVLEYLRNRKRRDVLETIKLNCKKSNDLQREINKLKKKCR